jgi:hypothetical protein
MGLDAGWLAPGSILGRQGDPMHPRMLLGLLVGFPSGAAGGGGHLPSLLLSLLLYLS